MEENLIDNEFDETPKNVVLDIMSWWEKKRLLFNLIIIGIALLELIPTLITGSLYIAFDLGFYIQSAFYLVFINCCYCAGWGVQLLRYYYLKPSFDSKVGDYVLFTLGTIFTGLVTYVGFIEYLRFK